MANHSADTVAVLGLGRFGAAAARTLAEQGITVVGVDSDEAVVNHLTNEIAHLAVADTTDEDAMRQLGLAQVERAIVAMGSDIEASILTAAVLIDLGVQHIWCKANTAQHANILRRIGVSNIVMPEVEAGTRVAGLVSGAIASPTDD